MAGKKNSKFIKASLASVLAMSLAVTIASEETHAEEDDNNTVQTQIVSITSEEALNIAMQDADLTEVDHWDDRELDTDDGVTYYEIEFTAGGVEYEYDIDANTGEIISSESEEDDDHGNNPDNQDIDQGEEEEEEQEDEQQEEEAQEGENDDNQQPGGEYMTSEDDLNIAMQDTGVDSYDYLDDLELEEDDGRAHYEIEFIVDGVEYEYEIDAVTGEIIDTEIDDDDAHGNDPDNQRSDDDDREDDEEYNYSYLEDYTSGIVVSSSTGELIGKTLSVEMLNGYDLFDAPHDLYDIEILNEDGSEYSPEKPVTVSIPATSNVIAVYYQGEDGETLEELQYSVDDGYVTFEVSDFSQYAVAYGDEQSDQYDDHYYGDKKSYEYDKDSVKYDDDYDDEDETVYKEYDQTDYKEDDDTETAVAGDGGGRSGDDGQKTEMLPDTGVAEQSTTLLATILAALGLGFLVRRKKSTN